MVLAQVRIKSLTLVAIAIRTIKKGDLVYGMSGMPSMRDTRVSFIVAWFALSVGGMSLLLAPFIVPHSILLKVSSTCESRHGDIARCPLCGMTTAFLLLSEGDLEGAQRSNHWSIFLFSGLLINSITALIFASRQVVRFLLRSSPIIVGRKQTQHS